MSLNLIDENLSMYLNHSAMLGKFVVDKEPIEVEYLVVHPEITTGYIKWTLNKEKFTQWDVKSGVRPENYRDLIADDYQRAFQARVCVDNKDVYIWETSAKTSLEVFDDMITQAYKTPESERANKAPCFKYEGAEKVTIGMWTGYKAKVSFVKWVDIPDIFDADANTEAQVDNKDDELESDIPF